MAKKNKKTDYRKYIILVLVIVLTYMLLKDTAIKILLYPLALFLGYYTTLYGKMIPHITPETMTATAIFAGMLFGSGYAFTLGLLVSVVVYALCGMMKLTTLINSVVIASGGIFAGLIMPFHLSPVMTFSIALGLRSVIGVLAFWNLTSDKLEAMAHAIVDPMFNMFFYMPFFLFIYGLL